MSSANCPQCGKKLFFTDAEVLCTKCRRENGLPPYDFVFVDIQPFKNLENKVEGFLLSWAARDYGFSTTEFWVGEDGQWYMEDEPYADDFLIEAMKFFLSNIKKEGEK